MPPTGARSRRSTPRPAAPIAAVAQAGAAGCRPRRRGRARGLRGRRHGARCPPAERSRVMTRLAELIEENADELAQIESLDNGKPVTLRARSSTSARGRAPALLRGLADEDRGRRRSPSRRPDILCLHAQGAGRRLRPDHPVELPAADGAWKIAPGARRRLHDRAQARRADAAHRAAPRRAALEAGIPAGVLNVVTGDGETGAALVDHPASTRSRSPARRRSAARSAPRPAGRSSA